MSSRQLVRVVLVLVLSLALSAVGSASARGGLSASAPAGPAAVALGAPGLSFRHVGTVGETEVPYFRSAGFLNTPWAVTIVADDVWIADLHGRRALRFATNGDYQDELGRAGLMGGVAGTTLRGVTDVAVDEAGHVWLADGPGAHVVELDGTGQLVADGGVGTLDDRGPGDDQLAYPAGLAFDGAGNLYLSDGVAPGAGGGNHRVQVFGPQGGLLATIGETGVAGADDTHLDAPAHLAVGGDRLYVADAGNHRVQVFDVSTPGAPRLVGTIGASGAAGADDAHLDRPGGVAVDNTFVFVADTGNCRVQVFLRRDLSYQATVGTGCGDGADELDAPSDVAISAAAELFVADAGNLRVVQYDRTRAFLRAYGASGVPYVTDGGHLNGPTGVALGTDGSLVVAEGHGHRLLAYDPAGALAWSVGEPGRPGTDAAHLAAPGDVALDAAGRIVVADTRNRRLQLFAGDGSLAATAGAPGWRCPEGVGAAPDGRLVVADPCRHVVVVLDAGLREVATLGVDGRPGAADDTLRAPADAAVDGRGVVYVADTGNHRIQVFDAGLSYLRTMGAQVPGTDFDHLDGPTRLAVGGEDRLYVADTGNHRVQVFDRDGAYLTTLGGLPDAGYGALREPRGLTATADGALVVADTENHRLQRFAPGVPAWRQENLNGFGDPANEAVSAVASFGGSLYAATAGEAAAARLWRRAGGTWSATAPDGFGDPANTRVEHLAPFGGALYAATSASGPGSGQLWRSANGADWAAVTTDGFGEPRHLAISRLAAFGSQLYAATGGITGTVGVTVWRSPTGDPGSWARVAADGFDGDAANTAVGALATHDGQLFAGTFNATTGGELWRTPDGTAWEQVSPDGFGSRFNASVAALAGYDGRLYATTGTAPGSGRGGVQVWRCTVCDGTDWERAGDGAFSVDRAPQASALAAFRDPQFELLYLALGHAGRGLEVWRTSDGFDWEIVATGGLGDGFNLGPSGAALAEHAGRLHLGTVNPAHGAELWSTMGTRPDPNVPTPPGPTPSPTPRPRPTPSTGRIGYRRFDQWPAAAALPPDTLSGVTRIEIADDRTVFLLDTAGSRIMRLKPDGSWGDPFGNTGWGPERIGQAGTLAVDSTGGRVYVGDHASYRMLVYGTDGGFVEAWDGDIYPVGIHVLADGRLWVADRLRGQVRLMSADGVEERAFGSYGEDEDDQFQGILDVAAADTGEVYVLDQEGRRLRVFRDSGTTLTRRRTINLAGRQTRCTGTTVTWLDGERVIIGACLLDGPDVVDRFPANLLGSDLYGFRARAANPTAGHFFALATYDADRFDRTNPTWPVVVQLFDERFDIVLAHWRGRDATDVGIAVGDPVRLSTGPTGSLFLLDDGGDRLTEWSADGRLLGHLGIRSHPSDLEQVWLELAVGEGRDDRVMGTGTCGMRRRVGQLGTSWPCVAYGRSVERRVCSGGSCEIVPVFEPFWHLRLPAEHEYTAAIAHAPETNELLVLRLHHTAPGQRGRGIEEIGHFITRYQLAERRLPTEEWLLEGNDRSAIWADVEVGPAGRVYALDTLGDRIQVFGPDGADLGTIPTPKDAWRVDGGPEGEAYVLTVYGHVVRLAPDGTELARFDVRPHLGVYSTSLIDLAVDGDGYAYSIDELANQVTVFAPLGLDDEALVGESCQLTPDKWAAPRDVILGDSARVLLSLFGSCGFVEQPSDVVLAINTYGQSMNTGRGLANQLRVARQIAALTDLDRHRLGAAAYATTGVVVLPLTQDTATMIEALKSVFAGTARSRDYAGVRTGQDVFQTETARRQVLIMIGPNSTDDAAIDLADLFKSTGTVIVTVNAGGRPRLLATSDIHAVAQVAPRGAGAAKVAHRQVAERLHPTALVKSGTLVDRLPANMAYVPGSASPAATWSPGARTLSWDLAGLPYSSTLFGFELVPQQVGEWPTNAEAFADVVDGWDGAARVTFPVPRVRVWAERLPTATRSPTHTPTPEPTPTPLPPPGPIFLPLTMRIECTPENRNADVALVVDTSGSMGDPTSPGGPTKLEAAKDAARQFIELLAFERDQAALLQFNVEAAVVVPLTADRAALLAGLDALTQQSGTRIDLALDAGREALLTPAHKPGNSPVLVLLTDGQPSGTTPDEVLAAGARAHEAGILVFTIGLGPDVDQDLMRRLATRDGWFFYAPDTSDLAAIYEQIAFSIPCPHVWP